MSNVLRKGVEASKARHIPRHALAAEVANSFTQVGIVGVSSIGRGMSLLLAGNGYRVFFVDDGMSLLSRYTSVME